MGRLQVLLLVAAMAAGVSAAPGHFRKAVWVNVGGAGAVDGGGEQQQTAVLVKPVYKPVPVPIEVPVYVEKPVEKPVYVEKPVEKPVYVDKPISGGGQGVAYGTVHINSNNFFDNIFNIPISVLRSVNQFLNNSVRGTATVAVHKQYGYGGGFAPAPAPAPASGGSSGSSSSSSSSSAQSSADSSAQSSAQSSASSSAQSSSSSNGF